MKAVGFTQHLPITDPASLQDFVLPDPVPGPRDLLVRVKAVAVNPVDTKVRGPKPGDPRHDPPKIIGWDASGVVEAVGADVTLFAVGDFYAETWRSRGEDAVLFIHVFQKPAGLGDYLKLVQLPRGL